MNIFLPDRRCENFTMSSSILQQYWIDQKKQQTPVPSRSPVGISTIDRQFNQWTNRSDVFSSASLGQIDPQFNPNNRSGSSTNLTVKEFCPEEDEDDEQSSSKRFVDELIKKKRFIRFPKTLR